MPGADPGAYWDSAATETDNHRHPSRGCTLLPVRIIADSSNVSGSSWSFFLAGGYNRLLRPSPSMIEGPTPADPYWSLAQTKDSPDNGRFSVAIRGCIPAFRYP